MMIGNKELHDDFLQQFEAYRFDAGSRDGIRPLSDYYSIEQFESVFVGDKFGRLTIYENGLVYMLDTQDAKTVRREALRFIAQFALTNHIPIEADLPRLLHAYALKIFQDGNELTIIGRGSPGPSDAPRNDAAMDGYDFTPARDGRGRPTEYHHVGRKALSSGDWSDRTGQGRRPKPEGGPCVFDRGQSAADWNR